MKSMFWIFFFFGACSPVGREELPDMESLIADREYCPWAKKKKKKKNCLQWTPWLWVTAGIVFG